MCLDVYNVWIQHTGYLGLRENEDKTQLTHKTSAGCTRLQRLGPFSGYVKPSLHALGASLGGGKANDHELARVAEATKVADKLRASPNSAAKRAFAAGMAATSKACFGWIARFPAKHLVSKLETRLKNAGYAHGAASTDLAKIVIGHSRDVCFTSGLNAIAAIHRAAKVLNCSP